MPLKEGLIINKLLPTTEYSVVSYFPEQHYCPWRPMPYDYSIERTEYSIFSPYP